MFFVNINRNSHPNKGNLHLNQKGTKVVEWYFVKKLSKQFDVCDSDESLDAESATDRKHFLKLLPTSNPDKLVFAHLNINSIRNKFEMLSDQIKDKIEVLLVSEPKINDSFPVGKF